MEGLTGKHWTPTGKARPSPISVSSSSRLERRCGRTAATQNLVESFGDGTAVSDEGTVVLDTGGGIQVVSVTGARSLLPSGWQYLDLSEGGERTSGVLVRDGATVALVDAAAGTARWREAVATPPVAARVEGDRAVVLCEREVVILGTEDGRRIWSTTLPDAVTDTASVVAVSPGAVVLEVAEYVVAAIRLPEGVITDKTTLQLDLAAELASPAAPALPQASPPA